MSKRFSKKVLAVVFCAVFMVVTAVIGVLAFMRPEKETTNVFADTVAEYIDSDITHFNNWEEGNPLSFDIENYGETAGNVYLRTSLWDIKTRIVAKANVQFTDEDAKCVQTRIAC